VTYQEKAHKSRPLLFVLSLLLIGAFAFNDVSASGGFNQNQAGNSNSSSFASSSPLIGIQNSQACMIMLKNHIPNKCITYDQITFLDNTNPLFAGLWIEKPYLHRADARVSNHYKFNMHPFVVMVDPNPDFEIRSKMIIIQSQNFTWINPDEISSNGIRIEHHNRFVSNCSYALVAPDVALINDTVNYLENGCKSTNYNDIFKIVTHLKPFSMNNPFASWHYSNYTRTHSLGGSGFGDCLRHHCVQPTDPYIKSNWNKK